MSSPNPDCSWCKGTGVAHDCNMVPGETAICDCPAKALPLCYEVGATQEGTPTITIRRKPSQIPESLDLFLIRLAGTAKMDGPNHRMTYEFLLISGFMKAQKGLRMRGWWERKR